MSARGKQLKEALSRYVNDTLVHLNTVRGFCESHSKWGLQREMERINMTDIKDRADRTNSRFSHVNESANKAKALWEYLKNTVTGESTRKKLEKELEAVVEDTLRGLEKLDHFLDAVEKLAVTSPLVFEETRVLRLPKGIDPEHVKGIFDAVHLIYPLLLVFKRDASAFFLPRLQNLEVMLYQLDKYISTTQKICKTFEESSFCLKMKTETVVELDADLSGDNIERMLYHITLLDEIRMDQHFRMAFLFQEADTCSGFIREFNERHPRLLQFLKDLDEISDQLERMNKGARISSVAGSSVGAVGGVLSIVGLALIPVTAGVSLALTMTGVGLGITSGVNSAVTTATEMGVNITNQKKASEVFKSFMEDVQSLQNFLEEVTSQTFSGMEVSEFDMAIGVGKVLGKVGTVGKGIDSITDLASGVKLLAPAEEMFAGAAKVVAKEGKALRNVPRIASDIPDIGQAAVKGPLAFSKSARAGFIVLNALFLGLDIFFICKDSVNLARGSETSLSMLIRTRAELWRSEIESWEKIRKSLCQSLSSFERKRETLRTPFYR